GGRTTEDAGSTTGGGRPIRDEETTDPRPSSVIYPLWPAYLHERRATGQQYRVTGLPGPAIPALASPAGPIAARQPTSLGRVVGGACRRRAPRRVWYKATRRFDRLCPGRTTEAERMPITLLDVILIGVMLISGLLAMIRGFMREVLSIAAWVIAALVTLYF